MLLVLIISIFQMRVKNGYYTVKFVCTYAHIVYLSKIHPTAKRKQVLLLDLILNIVDNNCCTHNLTNKMRIRKHFCILTRMHFYLYLCLYTNVCVQVRLKPCRDKDMCVLSIWHFALACLIYLLQLALLSLLL